MGEYMGGNLVTLNARLQASREEVELLAARINQLQHQTSAPCGAPVAQAHGTSGPTTAGILELRSAVDAAESRMTALRSHPVAVLSAGTTSTPKEDDVPHDMATTTEPSLEEHEGLDEDGEIWEDAAEEHDMTDASEGRMPRTATSECCGQTSAATETESVASAEQDLVSRFRAALSEAERRAHASEEQQRVARGEADMAIRNLEACQSRLASSRAEVRELERRCSLSASVSGLRSDVAEAASCAVLPRESGPNSALWSASFARSPAQRCSAVRACGGASRRVRSLDVGISLGIPSCKLQEVCCA